MKQFAVFFLLTTLSLMGQVSFEIQPRDVAINEVINFTINIEGASNERNPYFPNGLIEGDFQLVSSSPSTRYSMSMINGKSSSVRSYTYILRPTKEGQLTFPAQTVNINGELHKSEAITVKVGAERTSVSGNRRSDPFGGFQRQQQRRQAEVIVEASVPETEFYVGEGIPFQVNLIYTPGVNFSNQGTTMELPSFSDFWSEEIESGNRPQIINRNGESFEMITVDERRLYANRSGELTIDKANFNLTVSVGRSFFADWQRITRFTEPITLTIKPLPEAGKPTNFKGIVGNFELLAELDKPEIAVGESVNLRLAVRGTGNFSAISDLPLPELKDFEVFEGGAPTTEQNNGLTTSKSWAYALVPQREGSYQIEIPQLDFFDPQSGTYKSSKPQAFTIKVTPGAGLGAGSGPLQGRRDLIAAENLNFIKTTDFKDLKVSPSYWPPRWLLYLIGLFIVLDLAVFTVLVLRRSSSTHKQANRPKYALRNFKKKVDSLPKGDKEAFYAGLSQAVLDYFGDKWNRQGRGVSLDDIEYEMRRVDADEQLYLEIARVIETCEGARFAPVGVQSEDAVKQQAVQAVEAVEGALS